LTDVSPIAHADGGDDFWFAEDVHPGLAGGVDDGVVGLEDAI
jgi:hypothetical protein